MASDAVKCLRHYFRVAHMLLYFHKEHMPIYFHEEHMPIYFHEEHMPIYFHVADSLLYNLTQRAFGETTLALTQ